MWYSDYAEFAAIGAAAQKRRRNLRTTPTDTVTPQEFRQRYRFTKETFQHICRMLESQLEPPNKRNDSLSTEQQLLITLRFYATGNFQMTDADLIGVHQTTAGRIVHKVSKAIASLREQFISFPSPDELEAEKVSFYNLSRFPGVIGVIDGTHVRVQRPSGNSSELYRNRKDFFSLNVQIMFDSKLRVRDIVTHWYGSAHDSRIFQNSLLYDRLEVLPHGSWILGDSGYPCLPFLLTPFLSPSDPAQRRYNKNLIITRNCAERGIGVLKRRFPAIKNGLRVQIENSQPIIIACAILHNIAINNKEPEFDGNELLSDPPAFVNQSINRRGNAIRQSVVEQYFTN